MFAAIFKDRIGKRHTSAQDALNVDLTSSALSTEGKTPAQLKEVCEAQAALLVKQRDVLAQQRELIDTQRQQIQDQQSQIKILEQLVAQQKNQIAQPKAKASPVVAKAAPAAVKAKPTEEPKGETATASVLRKLLGV